MIKTIRWTLLMIPILVNAQSYRQILEHVRHALPLQSAKQLEVAAIHEASAAKSRNLPMLEAHLQALHLKETPTMILHFNLPGLEPEIPMGTKEQWVGDITLSYPLFTGFAITAMIDRSEYAKEMAHLKRLDLQRKLYLQTTRLCAAVYTADKTLKAQRAAQEAIEKAYRKAKGLYDNGLLAPADLYNIEAKKFAIEAQMTATKTQKARFLNQLSYLVDTPVTDVESLADVTPSIDKEKTIRIATMGREDLKALEASLHMDRTRIEMAKSAYYPTVAVVAAVKKQGDTLRMNGDGYRNADQSFLGMQASWNLFHGFGDQQRVEAARAKALASKIALEDYRKRIRTELDNAFLDLGALLSRHLSARMQVKAQEAYYRLTEGRFENQLASADELSRAIADLAKAHAKEAALKADIFVQKATIYLLGGLSLFEKTFLRPAVHRH